MPTTAPRTDADIPEHPVWSHSATPDRESWATRLGSARIEVWVFDLASTSGVTTDGSYHVVMLKIDSGMGKGSNFEVADPVVEASKPLPLADARAEAERLREDVKRLLLEHAL